MDPVAKQMLDGFSYSVKNYTASLGPENAKLKEAQQCLSRLEKKAEAGSDVAALAGDPDFARLGQLVGELAMEKPPAKKTETPAAAAPAAASGGIPPASLAAGGYHIAWQQLDGASQQKMKKYYDRIFEIEKKSENAVFFNAMLMEDGVLFAMAREPLLEETKTAQEKARAAWSPTVNFQQSLALKTYAAAQTAQELEFEAAKMAELSNVEHEWDALFLEVIGLLPACAQAIESFGPDRESVDKLKNSYRFMAEVIGVTWDDVFKNERYLYFWNNVAWHILPAEKKKMYAVKTPLEYAAVLKEKFFDPYVKDEPVPRKNPESKIRFWGREYNPADALKLLHNPPRPVIEPA